MQKRKERERASKEKILKKREIIRGEARDKREEFRKDKKIKKLQRDIVMLGQWADQVGMENIDNNTINQLQKNVEILKGLESEYEEEMKIKQENREKNLNSEAALGVAQDFYDSVPFEIPAEQPTEPVAEYAEVEIVKANQDNSVEIKEN